MEPRDARSTRPSARLQLEKADLRARMLALRGAISQEERVRRSGSIEQRLLALPEIAAAGSVMVFHSVGSEVVMSDVARGLAAGGRGVSLPFVDAGEIHPGAFDPSDPGRLTPGTHGIPEPGHDHPVSPAKLDVVVVPGLAFDRDGYRVGYGGGYYDRFLSRLPPTVARVGVAFQAQVVPEVPHGEGDEPMDVVVTEAEIIRTGRRGA